MCVKELKIKAAKRGKELLKTIDYRANVFNEIEKKI
jgi:hypothetical protein